MSYLISSALLVVFIALWAWARHDLTEERNASKRLQEQNANLNGTNNSAREEIGKLKAQRQKDIKALIRHFLIASKKRKPTEKAVQEIYDILWYVGNIVTVEDFLKYDFDYILKVAKYAKKGMLDIYYSPDNKPFRIGANGQHISLTDNEVEKMENKDYFFFSLD